MLNPTPGQAVVCPLFPKMLEKLVYFFIITFRHGYSLSFLAAFYKHLINRDFRRPATSVRLLHILGVRESRRIWYFIIGYFLAFTS